MWGSKLPIDDERVNDFETWEIISGPLEHFTTRLNLSSAAELLTRIQSPPFDDERWVFRGQSKAAWSLQPSIERLISQVEKPMSPHIERYVEREFKRRAHHYLQDLPDRKDDLEWLALMQHYGAPTRLLDWTKSPYVAAFFAAESASSAEPFAIWALDHESVKSEAREMLGLPAGDCNLASRKNFRKIYRNLQPEGLYLVAPVQPYRMNERLTIQQGLFLVPNNPLMGFERNLKSLLHHANQKNQEGGKWLYKLVVEPATRLDVLRLLNKMNINSGTLYPGLDGFARSLRTNTEMMSQTDWYKALLSDFEDV